MSSDSLPAELQAIVLKMKNQNWQTYPSGTNWEKRRHHAVPDDRISTFFKIQISADVVDDDKVRLQDG